jgi:hypothetical protein
LSNDAIERWSREQVTARFRAAEAEVQIPAYRLASTASS